MRHRVFAVAALLAAVPVATAAPVTASSAYRTYALEYIGGGLTTEPGQELAVRVADNIGAVMFQGGPEKFVSIEIADAHGLPVTGIVKQPDRDSVHICGATEEPLRVKPYENVTVYLMNGVCGPDGASVVTTGTVTAKFSRR